jgi:hypothetical protein
MQTVLSARIAVVLYKEGWRGGTLAQDRVVEAMERLFV